MNRTPYRAGSFYEADPAACRRSAQALVDEAVLPPDLPPAPVGGLVPHAGWVFSGKTAALTFKALAAGGRLEHVILLGSDHWGVSPAAAVYDQGAWQTPLGDLPVDEQLAAALLKECPVLRAQPQAHAREHSIEVQLPILQVLSPQARIVPISVPPGAQSAEIGRVIGLAVKRLAAARPAWAKVGVVGSTDLTHYGLQYGFTPGGTGRTGLDWARDNDRRILKLIETMQAERIVPECSARRNACGGGAIAATIAACAALGAARGLCLEYVTSADVMDRVYHQRADDAVGYAAVVFA